MIRPGTYLVTWLWNTRQMGSSVRVRVRRRWFPWPSRNVTFGRTVYEGGPPGMNGLTFLHELAHVWQYEHYGWWWVLTHPRGRERLARGWEDALSPAATWVQVQ